MFISFIFHAIQWSEEGFLNCTCLNIAPVCGPGTGTDPRLKSSVPDISFVGLFWLLRFVLAIPSAPCDFLYLNNE